MIFEVWDSASGNLLGTWDSEEQAVDVIRKVYETDGKVSVESLVLARQDPDGKTVSLGQGMDFINPPNRP